MLYRLSDRSGGMGFGGSAVLLRVHQFSKMNFSLKHTLFFNLANVVKRGIKNIAYYVRAARKVQGVSASVFIIFSWILSFYIILLYGIWETSTELGEYRKIERVIPDFPSPVCQKKRNLVYKNCIHIDSNVHTLIQKDELGAIHMNENADNCKNLYKVDRQLGKSGHLEW